MAGRRYEAPMVKRCPDCGKTKDETEFYSSSSYCKQCHNARMVRNRKQPHRRNQVNAANNEWLKRHLDVNRRNAAAFRERKRQKHLAWEQSIPPNTVPVQEAATLLGVSRQRVHQFIQAKQLIA